MPSDFRPIPVSQLCQHQCQGKTWARNQLSLQLRTRTPIHEGQKWNPWDSMSMESMTLQKRVNLWWNPCFQKKTWSVWTPTHDRIQNKYTICHNHQRKRGHRLPDGSARHLLLAEHTADIFTNLQTCAPMSCIYYVLNAWNRKVAVISTHIWNGSDDCCLGLLVPSHPMFVCFGTTMERKGTETKHQWNQMKQPNKKSISLGANEDPMTIHLFIGILGKRFTR